MRLAFIFSILLVGCTSGEAHTEETAERKPSAANLMGELPSTVHLACDQLRQYRIFFSEGIWDWKNVGGWSAYNSIAAITDAEIVLADGKVEQHFRRASLTLDRSDLVLVEYDAGPSYGVTVPSRPEHFNCAITEMSND